MPGFLIEKRRSMRSVSGFFEARKVSPSVPLEEERNSSSSCSSPLEPIYSSKCIPFYYGGKHKGACRSSSQTQGSRFLNVFAKDGDGIPSSGSCKNVSDEGEHDLAALVHDFIENGSGTSDPAKDGTQTENSAAVMVKLNDSLQGLMSCCTPVEKDTVWNISSVLVSFNGSDLACQSSAISCDGKCIRSLIVRNLRSVGYNAALCKAKWSNSARVPGGDYEYVDIMLDLHQDQSFGDRLIIDTGFRSQFEIARPVSQYQAMLRLLPVVFIGFATKVEQIVGIMCQAAKCSLQQNSMPLPPWRTSDYMKAKWFSPCERDTESCSVSALRGNPSNKHCQEQLAQLKSFLKKETKSPMSNRGKLFVRTKPNRR